MPRGYSGMGDRPRFPHCQTAKPAKLRNCQTGTKFCRTRRFLARSCRQFMSFAVCQYGSWTVEIVDRPMEDTRLETGDVSGDGRESIRVSRPGPLLEIVCPYKPFQNGNRAPLFFNLDSLYLVFRDTKQAFGNAPVFSGSDMRFSMSRRRFACFSSSVNKGA